MQIRCAPTYLRDFGWPFPVLRCPTPEKGDADAGAYLSLPLSIFSQISEKSLTIARGGAKFDLNCWEICTA